MDFNTIVDLISSKSVEIIVLAYFIYKDIIINNKLLEAIAKFTDAIEIIKDITKNKE